MSGFNGRLRRLEHLIDPAGFERCSPCGYPDSQIGVIVTEGDDELPTCSACTRPLDPTGNRPVSNEFTRVILMPDDDDE